MFQLASAATGTRPGQAARSLRAAAAFTLLELLVVIGIIAILVGIVIAVAAGVTAAGRKSLTTDTIRTLDQTLEEYIAARGAIPAATVRDPRTGPDMGGVTTAYLQPVADARNDTDEMINSVGLYLVQAREVAAIDELIKGLDAKLVRPYLPAGTDPDPPDPATQPELTTIFDGWGQPLRYVHPAFDGLIYGPNYPDAVSAPAAAVDLEDVIGPPDPPRDGIAFEYGITRIRRNNQAVGDVIADADGGLCTGLRPYFYSPGADGDPSTIEDNVYTTQPRIQEPASGFGSLP